MVPADLNRAIALFPGQGLSPQAIVEVLSDAPAHRALCREVVGFDPVEELDAPHPGTPPTTIMQVAIFLASMSRWERRSDHDHFALAAGHSLGEYAALAATGAFSTHDALRVLAVRAHGMEEVSRNVPGGMAAVMKLDITAIEEIAERAGVAVANDNAPSQVVISGPEAGLQRAEALTEEAGGRYVRLDIVGPFHTDAVAPVTEVLREALDDVAVVQPVIPVVSNVTARPFVSPADIRRRLVENLVSGVRWRGSMEWAWHQGIREYSDVGPGQVVGKLAGRIFGDLERTGTGPATKSYESV
jgi:[acyl-carrier-protein] S-malonyltransferase